MLTNNPDREAATTNSGITTMTNIASKPFDHEWPLPFRLIQRKLFMRMGGAAILIVLAACCGPFIHASTAGHDITMGFDDNLTAIVMTLIASVITTIGLYLVFRQQHRWLYRTITVVERRNLEIISMVGTLTELRDKEAAGHTLRAGLYTVLFAEALGLPPSEVVRAAKGALLHDVGKLVMPDHGLGKPGPLMPDDRAVRKMHVRLGMEVVSQWPFLSEAASVIGSHHEHYDGGGYPCGLKGEGIPRDARMFALIDVFDALTSPHIYKPARTVEEALAYMADGRGGRFDPTLFDSFVEWAPVFYRQLPRDESALLTMLADRLLPYFPESWLG